MIQSIDQEKCTGCGTCMEICPVDTFRIEEEIQKAGIKYPEDCLTCFLCEMRCPEEAIFVHPFKQVMPPVFDYQKEKDYGTAG